MIIKDARGNEFLEMIYVDETQADKEYHPVNHALAVVKVGNDYLMGWNHWRKDWEVFGGCREEGETLRECIVRECKEELGIENVEYTYLGLMKYNMAPGYFNSDWHIEYGGLYGVTLPADAIDTIRKHREDRKEIETLEFYNKIQLRNKISKIDEKLLEYWK
ncbi:MAG: NUDIX hydrolase [Eubacterium sp.]